MQLLSLASSRGLWLNTVVLLPLTLRQRTRTLLGFQGTTYTFFVLTQKVVIRMAKAAHALPLGLKTGGLRRLKPHSVIHLYTLRSL
jgi:hypothetical protein